VIIAEAAAAGAAVAASGAVVAWRTRDRKSAVQQVRHAMVDPDPATRRAAVYLAAEEGLGPYTDLLLERTAQEHDETVLAAVADAVARNRWEPADNRRLVELRTWAHQQLEGQPVMTVNGNGHVAAPPAPVMEEIAVPAGPPPPTPPTPTPTPTPAPAPLRQQGRSRGLATVLVTGAGGAAGVAVIRALTGMGHGVVAADADGLAVGLRLARDSTVLPRCDDDNFVAAVCDVATRTGAAVLVSTVAEEMMALADNADLLDAAGIAHWLPAPSAVEACVDKWRFAQVLVEHGIAGPVTNLGSADGVPGAWIVKPRFGRGSRDVFAVDRPDEMAWALAKVPQPIVQTRLSGKEFTVDALVDRNGRLAGAAPRWRLETKAGISTKGRTFEDDQLVDDVGRLLAAVGLRGPANIQGFVGSDGRATFVEVNPRFSGGLPLSMAAGADLVGEYVGGILGEHVRPDRLAFRPGVTMLRHFEEVFE